MPPIPNNFGFTYQLQQFAASGTRFSETDLIALSIGGNDLSAVNLTGLTTDAQMTAQITASATASAGRAVAGVQQLVAAGARNIAWLGTGTTKWFPEPPGSFTAPQRDTWADTYYQQTQQLLAPLAHAGVRVFLFNFGILQERVANNPGLYGFTSATNCEAGAPEPGVTPASVRTNFAGCFYNNSVHPTGPAMAVIARYMSNQIDAPTTVVPQGAITTGIAAGFANATFGRLDAYRAFQAFAVGPAIAKSTGMPTKAPGAAPEARWSFYGDVNYANGSLERQFYAAGYDYHALGGTVGIEYRLDPRIRLGAVLGYSEPDVNLSVQNAHDHIKSFQLAGYGSFTDLNWFADALLAYGHHDHALDRDGVIDVIHAGTSADTVTAAAKTGYLIDVGPVRAGPIAGLNYTHGTIRAYTETGDILLTMMVDRQAFDALTGGAGLQVRYPFLLGSGVYSPFVNVTAEHDFSGFGRTLTTTQVTTPLLPVLTPVSDNGRTYGKVGAGIAAVIAGNVSAQVNATTTFAREGGNDFTVGGGIRVSLR